MKLSIYVSGPMTGIPEHNFPAFAEASERLRAAGYLVINPAENWGGATDTTREQCMRLDIQQVLVADGLALLPGWEQSAGARCEVDVARQVSTPIDSVEWWVSNAEAFNG